MRRPLTAIIAPLPDGVTGDCLPGTPKDGCRILKLEYTGTGTATRLSKISAQVNTDADRVLSTYTYTSGRLTGQTDSITGLTTNYTWTGTDPQPKLASITPPGQSSYSYTYAADGKLSKVTRPVPATAGGGTAQLAAIIYNGAPTGIGGLDLTQFAAYNLPRTATTSFAVFGPDAPITSTPAASAEAWKRADVWLTDAEGYTIHEARYGAGDWQMTANIYDASDNVIEAWDTRATAAIRNGDYTDIASAATSTKYNETDIKSADGTTVLVPARTRSQVDAWFDSLLTPLEGQWPEGRHHHGFDDDVWFVDAHPFTPRHAVTRGAYTTVHLWVFSQVGPHFGAGHPALSAFPRYLLELARAWSPDADRAVWLQEVGAPTSPTPMRLPSSTPPSTRSSTPRASRPSPGGAATT